MENNMHVAVTGAGRRATAAEVAALHDQFVNGQLAETPQAETVENTSVKDGTPMHDSIQMNPVNTSDTPSTQDESGEEPKETIDFSGKDFEETQVMLNQVARVNSLRRDIEGATDQKRRVIAETFKHDETTATDDKYPTPDDVIQYHLDKWEKYSDLERYLNGSLKEERIAKRINKFFTHPETGEVLEMVANPNVKTEINELDFKRGLILYFKRNDEYLAGIDEEIKKLNKATEELDENVKRALNPLKDNVLAYSEYLLAHSQPEEGDDTKTSIRKSRDARKATAIRSAYTLENMIELIKEKPGIKANAMKDFRTESRVREIGKRYSGKLRSAKINFNLFPLLSDDPHDSLEYKTLPQGDYPAGFEGFTVFFIIRSLSMTLPNPEDITFHAAVQVAFTQLMNGTIDPDVADTMRKSISEFLNLVTTE